MGGKSPPATVKIFKLSKAVKKESGHPPVPAGSYVMLRQQGREDIFGIRIDADGVASENVGELMATGWAPVRAGVLLVRSNTDYSAFWIDWDDGNKLTPEQIERALGNQKHKVRLTAADATEERFPFPDYQSVDLRIVKPSGDPARNGGPENQFVYSEADPGVLEIECRAEFVPARPDLEDKVRWKIDPIGDSHGKAKHVKVEWSPAWPGKPSEGKGLVAKVKFTGLPRKNDDFGKKKITVAVEGTTMKSSTEVMVFFPRDATNHPAAPTEAGSVPKAPNWFYYWLEVAGSPPDVWHETQVERRFRPSAHVFGSTPAMTHWKIYPGRKRTIVLYDLNVKANDAKRGGEHEVVTGIDCFANTLLHEQRHVAQIRWCDGKVPWTNPTDFGPEDGWSWHDSVDNRFASAEKKPEEDLDSNENWYPDAEESATVLARAKDPDIPYYGEVDAGDAETVVEGTLAPKDWGCPGKQCGKAPHAFNKKIDGSMAESIPSP